MTAHDTYLSLDAGRHETCDIKCTYCHTPGLPDDLKEMPAGPVCESCLPVALAEETEFTADIAARNAGGSR